ncbi:MAG: hypothetical protein EA356_01455 [Geminicoccaceae bacterium]|nr:MAG: hypothetical protein EA356_01455 [Geminicoccaceae bacterium]
MALDDPKLIAALLRTAEQVLTTELTPQLDEAAKLRAATVARALALAASTLERPATSWPRQTLPPVPLQPGSARAAARDLRPHVQARLERTNPDYAHTVASAPV